MRGKLSAFVISYNRADLLETCLRAVSFADELIVVDKSSTDNSVEVAARYADRIEVVPWSPTVEETRAFAASLCRHEWILFLDDDEILSRESGPWLRNALDNAEVDIYAIPLRHYILGMHDENAYYWPEEHRRLFRKGALEFIPTVHGGVALQTERIVSIPADTGVCIHHLSYRDVASWIERTNRYTSRPDRVQVASGEGNLIKFAHDQIEFWMGRTTDPTSNEYPAAVALLRAIYDMVDRLKAWEKEHGLDGAELFRIARETLVPETNDASGRARVGEIQRYGSEPASSNGEVMTLADLLDRRKDAKHMEMQETLVLLRSTEAQLRDRSEVVRRSNASLTSVRNELQDANDTLAATRNELDETRANLTRTRESLEQTETALLANQAALEETQGTLRETRETLRETQGTLRETQEALGQTTATLHQAVMDRDQSRAALVQTHAELHQSRTSHDETHTELDECRAALKDTQERLEHLEADTARLSGSARLFVRQYLPKLRRHLSRQS